MEKAREVWANGKVRDGQFRALNPRNPYDSTKRVWSPDEGKTIRFRFHHTDLVEYTDTTVRVRVYDSNSSATFADMLTPYGIRARSYQGSMWVNSMQPATDALVFVKTGDKYEVEPNTVMPQYKVVVDKKISAQVQKRLRPFLQYRRARAALEHQRQATGDMRAHWNLISGLEEHCTNPMTWPRLYEQFLQVSDAVLHRELVARAGGVEKVPLPIGVLPVRSKYDAYVSLF